MRPGAPRGPSAVNLWPNSSDFAWERVVLVNRERPPDRSPGRGPFVF
jgi:hypothetical protein